MKVIFRDYLSHLSGHSSIDLATMEGDDIFVPRKGDSVIIGDLSGEVILCLIYYDLQNNETVVEIRLEIDE